MMRVFTVIATASAVLLTITGCLNLTPEPDGTRFYVLGVPSDGDVDPAVAQGPFFARPEVPAYLRGTKMVYRTVSGEMRQVGGHRWAEPVDEGVARALARAWSARTGKLSAGFYPWAQPAEDLPVVRVRLHAFGADDRGVVVLEATWELTGPEGSEPAGGRFSSRIGDWQPGDAEGLVAAMNVLLEQLAAEIPDR